MTNRGLRCFADRARLALADGLPVILFFLCAFYTILWLFGVKYIIVVSVLATLFKVRCRKKQTKTKLLSMAAVQMSLAVLAFLAGHWLILCVILNILVPFFLVFLQSTQFNQKGYFTSAMGFVFFQLSPVSSAEFGRFLCAMAYGLLLLSAALLIYSHGRAKEEDYGLEKRGMEMLAGQLSAWVAGEESDRGRELFSIQRALYKQVEQSRGISYAVNREGQVHYMAALLFQRSVYFLTVLREKEIGEDEKRFLLRLCDFLREFGRRWPGTGSKPGEDHEGNGRGEAGEGEDHEGSGRGGAGPGEDHGESGRGGAGPGEDHGRSGRGEAGPGRRGPWHGNGAADSTVHPDIPQCLAPSGCLESQELPSGETHLPPLGSAQWLRLQGQALIRAAGLRDDGIGRFGEQTVSLLLMLLDSLSPKAAVHTDSRKRPGAKAHPLAWILGRFRPDAFELRFSLRLSAVLVLGFLFSRLSGCNHAYWFVLNAFLLLQPMYEDSAFRLKNRFIGTIAGCTLLYFVLPLFPGIQGHFALATVIVAFMYCTLPGTWQQAVFSTAFSITLASLAMQETMAMELRLVYVGLATVFVVVVNRFFFPTSMRGQFQDNIRGLFHMQHSYLRIFAASLHVPLDYGAVRDGLVRFQLMYEQIEDYLQKRIPAGEQAGYRQLLELFWKMSSEMEQILFLTAAGKQEIEDTAALEHFACVCSYVIREAGNMVCIKMKQEPVSTEAVPVTAEVEGAPYLSALLKKYSQDVSALYRLALDHKLGSR